MVAGLPRELKDAKLNQSRRRSEHQAGQMVEIDDKTGKIKNGHQFIILRNYPFIMIIAAIGFESGFRSAVTSFGTKYMEEMFDMSTSNAAILCGIVLASSCILGQVLGGFWTGKTSPTVAKQLQFCTLAALISLLCLGSSYVLQATIGPRRRCHF